MDKIIFASKNKGKIEEVKDLFKDTGIEIISLNDLNDIPDIEETGKTFEENSKLKAEEIFKLFNQPVIADDSGLEIDQLEKKPGVYSARYAGENSSDGKNNKKMLKELEKYPEPHTARYVCAAVYFDGKDFIVSHGKFEGQIIKEGKGTNGFGYDPYFVPDGYNITLGEMELDEKNKISHRAKAFNDLKKKIIDKIGEKYV
jgi:XTP/dITP diphosphohydrolase